MKNRRLTVCEQELKGSGITIVQMEERKRRTGENFIKCLWNGLIIFLFTAGLIAMFAASFDMPCNYPVIIAVCAAYSFAFALLYLSGPVYNIGYIFMMVLIVLSTVGRYVYINSGYNAVLNIMTEAVKEEMSLPYMRQHAEWYADRNVTVTAFFSLIAGVLAMFFNMWVSRRKSVAAPLLVTFPVLELCIYLNDDFSYLSLAVLLSAFSLFVVTVQNDPVPMDKKKKQLPWHTVTRRAGRRRKAGEKRGSETVIVLHQDRPERRGSAAAAVLFVLASLLVAAACSGFVSDRFASTPSSLKKASDRVVKEVAMHGFEGFLMRGTGRGRGGMSQGSFGDVSSVYLDYETDLEITLVPYTEAPVYLPSYTGAIYDAENRKWSNPKDGAEYGYDDVFERLGTVMENGDWEKYKALEAVLLVRNLGVSDGARNTADSSGTDTGADFPAGESGAEFSGYYSKEPVYVPLAQTEDDYTEIAYRACLLDHGEYGSLGNLGVEPQAGKINTDIYTGVPDSIRENLEEICAREGFGGSVSDIIGQIQAYMADNLQYTVSPGRTPLDRDFVLYFLEEKKAGYCVHFASSACLLLRTMGIPARYAEGYCFDYRVYEEARLYEGERAGWNTGYSALEYDSPVTVELTDGNAHAWVEVYFEGFGWVPVEFTVGTVADGSGSGIMDFLRDLFPFGMPENNNGGAGQNFFTGAGEAIQNWFESRFGEQLLILLAAVLGFFLIKYMIYIFRAYFSPPGYRAVFQYRTLVKRARRRLMRRHRDRRDYYGGLIISHDVMRGILSEEYGLDAEYADRVMSEYERFNYSDKSGERDIRRLSGMYRRLALTVGMGRIKG